MTVAPARSRSVTMDSPPGPRKSAPPARPAPPIPTIRKTTVDSSALDGNTGSDGTSNNGSNSSQAQEGFDALKPGKLNVKSLSMHDDEKKEAAVATIAGEPKKAGKGDFSL